MINKNDYLWNFNNGSASINYKSVNNQNNNTIMRKVLSLLLLMVIPMVAMPHEFEVDGIYYNRRGNEAIVTYRGLTSDSYSDEYSGSISIPSSVTYNGVTYLVSSIGEYAFCNCEGLSSISLPNSITAIHTCAFYGCSQLTSIEIPNSITRIEYSAFAECTNLLHIEIPNSVTIIEQHAFKNTSWYNSQPNGLVYAGLVAYQYKGSLSYVTNIEIKEGTVSIAEYAFLNCTNLSNIEIPNSVIFIGGSAFYGTQWYNNQPEGLIYAGRVAYKYKGYIPEGTEIVLEEGTLGIADGAFTDGNYLAQSGLKSVIIPSSVIAIGEGAFHSCTGLTNFEIPSSIKYIGELAFYKCPGPNKLEIPNSVISIGDGAFAGCKNINSIIVDSNNPYFDSRDNCNAIIETKTNTLIYGCKTTKIPNSVMSIGHYAFSNCKGINNQSIILPQSVTTIEDYAFYETNLKSIIFLGEIERIGNYAFKNYELPNDGGRVNYLAFLGQEVNNVSETAFRNGGALSGYQRNINNLIFGSKMVNIEGLNIKPGNDIICYCPVPPVADETSFLGYNSVVHVPAASLAVYFTAPYWSNFANIVGDAIEPMDIIINQNEFEVNIGTQFVLNATVSPANATPNNITWTSTNTNIARVYNGTVTAVGNGECDIIAQCLDKSAICHVVVNDTIVTIILDQVEAMVLPNHIVTIMPSATPIMPQGFTVTSSDPSVAAARIVGGIVQVVGIKEGTTTITVGSVDGTAIPAGCLVTVYTELGDLNCDGFVNISDVTSLINHLLSGDSSQISSKNADVNGDERINISDVTTLINILLQGN